MRKQLFLSVICMLLLLALCGCDEASPEAGVWQDFSRDYSGYSYHMNTTDTGSAIHIQVQGQKNADGAYVGGITVSSSETVLFSHDDCYVYPDNSGRGFYWVCDSSMSEANNGGEGLPFPSAAFCAFGTLLTDPEWNSITFLHMDQTADGKWEDIKTVFSAPAKTRAEAEENAAHAALGSFYADTWLFSSEWQPFTQQYEGYRWAKNNEMYPGQEVTILLDGKKNDEAEFVGSIRITAGDEILFHEESFYISSAGVDGNRYLAACVESAVIDHYFGEGHTSTNPGDYALGYVLADPEFTQFTLWSWKYSLDGFAVAYTAPASSREEAATLTEAMAKDSVFYADTW